ncbi:MAG TPA: sulfatase-like hydrolase/transferase [Chitinophagaceae bacterium]|nr:sulfatase-like hydrolase/transferase [Chitinophagaceae bacterium]
MKKFLFFGTIIMLLGNSSYSQQKKVPVIIIMCDQLRYDAIGKFTPNIDQLKNDGISFNRTYCASPICVPSRASFFTGRYPNNNGSLINGWQPEDDHFKEVRSGTPNLYEVMANNWDSWHVGKQHFLTQDKIDKDPKSKTKWITDQTYKQWLKSLNIKAPGGPQLKAMLPELTSGKYTYMKKYSTPGFEEYKPGLKYFDDEYYTEKAVDVIKNYKGDQPLLLNLMFLSPHPPYSIPEPYFSKFKTSDLTIPDNVGKWYPGQSSLQLYNLTGFIGTRYTRDQWTEVWPKYFGLVSLVDDEIGKVIGALKSAGMYDKALIIFTADHGEMLGSHSLWQKMCMYEESSRVPLIIKFPSDFKPAFKETNDLVSLIDVWPSLMDYLNISANDKTDGESLMPLVKGGKQQRTAIFIQYDGNGGYGNNQRCVVEGDYKLIIDTFKDEIFLELYNVIADPEEKVNLVTDPKYETTTKNLIEKIRQYMSTTNDLLKLPDNLYENFLRHYLLKNKGADDSD